jgi:glutaredoxin
MVITLYRARGCHLCDAAFEVIESVRREVPFELELVDIAGDPDLEARYRELLPVVEVDGQRAFTWFVDPEALRERLLRPRPDAAGTM